MSVLFDLTAFMQQFSVVGPTHEDELNDMWHAETPSVCFGPDRKPVEVGLHPIGLLKSIGHVSATDGFPPVVAHVRALCRKLSRHRGHLYPERIEVGGSNDDAMDYADIGDDSGEDTVEGMRNVFPVEIVSMRGYNALSAKTPASPQYHEPQLGLNSGIAAGTHATSPEAQSIAHKFAEKNCISLPHDRFTSTIAVAAHTPRDVHLETVFVLNLDGLRTYDREGRYVIVLSCAVLSVIDVYIFILSHCPQQHRVRRNYCPDDEDMATWLRVVQNQVHPPASYR